MGEDGLCMNRASGHFSTRGLLAIFVATLCSGALFAGCPPSGAQACDTDAECPDGRCRFGACGPICEEDGDCGSRQVCQAGACVPSPECAQTSDCASGFICTSGACACTGDAACALNQSCVGGRCEARARCTSDLNCDAGQRCEVTQGLCIPPCTFATDCAPGLDPQVATVLYQCFQGTCHRRCVNDVSCGATGLICADGLCTTATCKSAAECPMGQYCTSANFGRCQAFQTCTATSQCQPNFECRAFDPQSCPPGFNCAQPICQELQRCLVDPDCNTSLPGQRSMDFAFCREGHCQPTKSCTAPSDCAAGWACVGKLCVPGGCRGHTDCPTAQACVAGACKTSPNAIDVASLKLSPEVSHLEVGAQQKLQLISYTLDGASFPVASASFSVVDEKGAPSGAATVDASGQVTGVSAAKVLIRAEVPGAAVLPITATVYIHASVSAGRRVLVIDPSTQLPVASATVRGCDAPSSDGPCAAPIEVTTDVNGEAPFPTFSNGGGAAVATFSVGSGLMRADGLPRYERVSLLDSRVSSILLPLEPNPVQSAAGFNGTISFNQVHSDGAYWVGFAAMSAGDPAATNLQDLLGEAFWVDLPGVMQRVPVPGSVVLYTSPGLGIPNEVKGKSLGLAQPGRRTATAFAGRTSLDQLASVRSTDFLAYAGALDYALVPFSTITSHARVPDTTDVDGDGLCTNAMQCPQGTEKVPDYFNFTQLSVAPRDEQTLRTEVVLPELPAEYDTAVIATISATEEAGLTPLGFTSRTAGAPNASGLRPIDPVVMRSGAPFGGVEAGAPGVWVMAVQAASATAGGGSVAGRIIRGPTLPTRAVIPALLPSAAQSTFVRTSRTFAPAQPLWNELVSGGGELGRIDLLGSEVRHRVYFEAEGAQTAVRVPEGPPSGGMDPAAEQMSGLEVTILDLRVGVSAQDAFNVRSANLSRPGGIIDGYSRWQGQ